MNVLLLGTSDSVFIRDFCLYVLDKKCINTVILSPTLSKRYSRDYSGNRVKEIRWPDFFLKGIRRQAFAIPYINKEWHDLGDEIGFGNTIDAIHVHYVEPLHLIYFFPFWKKSKKRILTFWGSDFFGATKKKLLLYPYFLKQSTSIVFMIQNQCESFQQVFGHKYDDKIHVIDFGNSLLNVIDTVSQKYTVEECKRYFDLPTDKLVVHIGYNASRAQQHIELLKRIVILPDDILKRLILVFHISYGTFRDSEAYRKKLEKIMNIVKLDYRFIDTYLQGEELAMFRRTCDIFIYGQKTDARSASPLEYIYAGAKFICPGWLADNYELLNEAQIKYYVYSDFEQLPGVVENCIKETTLPREGLSGMSRKRIRDEISWDSLAEKWRQLYE